ncbi:hypothetical protein QQ045_006814 [Rhodiola kirilowii]
MALYRRLIQIGATSKLSSSVGLTSACCLNPLGRSGYRHLSQLVKSSANRAFLVDTLALVKSLESQGVPSKQAEAITSAIIEVLNDSLENVAQSFVSKAEMQKNIMAQEANLSTFKSEVKSSQEHHFSMLQRETEKLRGDIDKMRSELRYEIDKVTAGQRLDLNLERGYRTTDATNHIARHHSLLVFIFIFLLLG